MRFFGGCYYPAVFIATAATVSAFQAAIPHHRHYQFGREETVMTSRCSSEGGSSLYLFRPTSSQAPARDNGESDANRGGDSGSGSDDDADSIRRRNILFSLLAAASGSTAMSSSASAAATAAVDASTPWSLAEDDDVWAKGIIDNIMKPPLDDRDYVAYRLPNGLRVILCSDPSSIEGGAAMDVHVGACSDPEKLPGLAHFNEHMLFLGTKPYPKEDSFETFLASNGGSSNAYTDSENTVYHFTMSAESDVKTQEGLKRFGSFFTSPLFTESATGRELNAIESEHAKNLQSDNFRLYQLEKARQPLSHPHSKFFTGNKQTLQVDAKAAKINIREELIRFYNRYYSANQMTLAVVGPQSIESLKSMVEQAFGDIPNKNVPAPEDAWKRVVPPYSRDPTSSLLPSYGYMLKIVPVQDIRRVSLSWPIIYESDEDMDSALLTKQANYVAHLIGHEGPNSLLSYLKRRGWANSLASASESELSDYEIFQVDVGLTRAGLTAVDQVIAAVFSYLSMLQTDSDRRSNIPQYVMNEVLQLEELQWRFYPKSGIDGYVTSLATSLQKYPPTLAVAGPRRLALSESATKIETDSTPRTSFTQEQYDFTMQLTQRFINQLTVDNMVPSIMSTSFNDQTDRVEKWYGTKYRIDPIPDSTLDRWRVPPTPSSLGIAFPKPNVFIPSEDGLRVRITPGPVDRTQKRSFESRLKTIPPPEVIRDDGEEGRWTVYYKPDERFGQPKAFVIFQLLTSQVYSNAFNAALSTLYELSVSDKLNEYAYDAGLAGLSFDVKVLPRGVRLTFGGYNDKLQKFATYISKKISTDMKDVLPTNIDDFERYKDTISRGLAAFDFKQPYSHCSYYSTLTMEPLNFQYTNKDLREAIDKATMDDLAKYVASLWSSGKGLALVQGNLSEGEAKALVDTVDKAINFQPISRDKYPSELVPLPLPEVKAKGTPTRLVVAEPNLSNGNSASYVALQCLSEDEKEHVLMELLGSIVSEPFYENLRTRQQLGYIVSSGIRALGKTRFMAFVVQSSVADTDKLTKAVLKYLDSTRSKLLEPLGEADFTVYVKSLIERKTEPDKVLSQEVTRNWAEIASGRYQFNRVQSEVAALLSLSKADLLEFWDKLYVNDGRRVMITEMVPRVGPASSAPPPTTTGYTSAASVDKDGLLLGIDDIEQFRIDRDPRA